MKRGSQILLGLLLAVSGMTISAEAQWSIEPRLGAMNDDNINNNALHLSDRVAMIGLNAGYAMEVERWSLSGGYAGSLEYFQTYIERTNQFHSLNVAATRLSGEDDADVLRLDLSYGNGWYHSGYAFYDHRVLSLSMDYKQFLSEVVINRMAYTVRSMRFSQLPDFNYTEHAILSNLNVALPTQTTLILQAELGAKYYGSPDSMQSMRGSGTGASSLLPDVAQLAGSLRIGQSLFEGTGVSVTAKYLWNVRKHSRVLTSSSGVIADDEVFDDHYGYEGPQVSVMLTQVLGESALLRLTTGYQSRTYSSLGAFDQAGVQIADERRDDRLFVNVMAEWTLDSGITFRGVYDVIRNTSNDPFYGYANNALTTEILMPF